jgi:hypothetical protein
MGWEDFECISPLEYATPHHETGMNSFDSLRFISSLESGESWRDAKTESQFLFAFAMSYFSTFNPPLSGKDQVIFRFMINLRPKLDQTTCSTQILLAWA